MFPFVMKDYSVPTFFLLAVLAAALGGCAGTNVKPGDLDYPQENERASNVLEVHGTIDPGLPIKFATYWISTKAKSWPVADGNCNYMFNRLEGVSSTYTAHIPLKPEIRDGSYSVELKTDAFLPGRCGWRFSGLLVYTDDQVFDSLFSIDAAELLVDFNPSLPRWAGMIQPTGERIDVLCETSKYLPSEAPHDGTYLKCIDAVSRRKLRVTLHGNNPPSIELNIHRENRSN